jgi:hypothetical protein
MTICEIVADRGCGVGDLADRLGRRSLQKRAQAKCSGVLGHPVR